MLNLAGAFICCIGAAILTLPLLFSNSNANVSHTKTNAISSTLPGAPIDFTVKPGDIEIEQGSPLTISAIFQAPPTQDVILETTTASGTVSTVSLKRPFTDPTYQTRLRAVNQPLTYRVLNGTQASSEYKITTYLKPAVESSKITLHFPKYLNQEPEVIHDPRAIKIPSGTRIELTVDTNLPNLEAKLSAKKQSPLFLQPTQSGTQQEISFSPEKSARYEIILTDSKGRRNGKKDILNVKVIPNKAPVFKIKTTQV